MTVLLLACLMMLGKPDGAKIFIGADANHVIMVDAAKLGKPLDVAYDEERKLLYTYSERPDGQHVTRWDASGRLLADWRLSWALPTECAITLYRGKAVLRSWDEVKNKSADLIFPWQDSGKFTIEDIGPYTVPSPGTANTVKKIREIMLSRHWTPFAQVGVHVIDSDLLIKTFMATNPVREERIAWTADYSVVSYTWDNGSAFQLAVANGQGGYTDRDIFKNITKELGWAPNTNNQLYLYSICVSHNCAAYGFQIEHASPNHKVAWIDLTAPDWPVKRTETGYLARTMIEIGY